MYVMIDTFILTCLKYGLLIRPYNLIHIQWYIYYYIRSCDDMHAWVRDVWFLAWWSCCSESGWACFCGSTPSPCWTLCRASLCRSSPSSRSACFGSSAVQTGWVVHVCIGVLCALLVLRVLCPQLSLAGTVTSIIFVMTKTLSHQRRVCWDKTHLLSG